MWQEHIALVIPLLEGQGLDKTGLAHSLVAARGYYCMEEDIDRDSLFG